ncbi:MAG TPA: diguanylate cyclase [Burkholderiales bacterium]|nr:diguanylate cyclase [Burkholderiales bacterium]
MKILLVDDSATIRAATETMLVKMGHEVVMAVNGEDALLAYKRESPNLVLMDVNMPVMDGYAAAQRIRSEYPQDWVPIIFLSGANDEEHLELGIRAGGDDYLIKPCGYVVLHAKIRAMQRLDEMRRRQVQTSTELLVANKQLEQIASQDGLTELANRRSFDVYLAAELARARRSKKTVALVLCDVDFFKPYNDHYGHPAGDECLKRVAAALQSACRRPADLVARYGGEEFALVLPDTELNGAVQVAETVRKAVEGLKVAHEHSSAASYVSISAGVAAQLPDMTITAEQLIMAADEALYQAKHLGRNRVVVLQAKPA